MTLEKLNLGTGVLLAAFAFNVCSDDNSATAGPDSETRAECTAQKLANDSGSIFEFTCEGKIAGSTENGFCKFENSGAGSANKPTKRSFAAKIRSAFFTEPWKAVLGKPNRTRLRNERKKMRRGKRWRNNEIPNFDGSL